MHQESAHAGARVVNRLTRPAIRCTGAEAEELPSDATATHLGARARVRERPES